MKSRRDPGWLRSNLLRGALTISSLSQALVSFGDEYFINVNEYSFRPTCLCVLLTTYRSLDYKPDTPELQDRERGYLLTMPLAADLSTTGERLSYGPLWSIEKSQSTTASAVGAPFTEKDKADFASRVRVLLRPDGSVDRYRESRDKNDLFRDRLVLSEAKAHWLAQEPMVRQDVAHGKVIDRLVGKDRLHMVDRHADGTFAMYLADTGKPFADEWLRGVVKSIADVGKTGDLHESSLSPDMNTLVLLPFQHGEWNIDGKTSSREKFGLFYQRPSTKPIVIDQLDRGTEKIAVVDDNLRILERKHDSRNLRLLDLQRNVVSETTMPKIPSGRHTHSELGIYRVDVLDNHILLSEEEHGFVRICEAVRWVAWDIRRNTCIAARVDLDDAVEMRDGWLTVKSAIPVGE